MEACTLEARHIDKGCAVFAVAESKGKRKRRVVPLDETTLKLVKKLAKANPSGPIFRNTIGTPWNANTLNDGCERYAKKVDLKIIPYIFRHSFITRALLNDIPPLQVATMVGHEDLNMINKVYSQLKKKNKHLQELVAKANNPLY